MTNPPLLDLGLEPRTQIAVEFVYVGDPMCSWCWGFAPALEKLDPDTASRCELSWVDCGRDPRPSPWTPRRANSWPAAGREWHNEPVSPSPTRRWNRRMVIRH